MDGFEIAEFDEDGALDERDTLIHWLEERIDRSTSTCIAGFSKMPFRPFVQKPANGGKVPWPGTVSITG